MNKIGLLFPGQGSQFAGMGRTLYNEIPKAKRIMDDANEILGFDMKKLIFEGNDEDIVPTEIAQPAIFTVSTMYFEKYKLLDLGFDIIAGHSLGEYTALYVAEVLNFENCLNLVRKRGLAMSQVNSLGTMYAIMGVDLTEINKYLDDFVDKVVVANVNSKTQIIISGLTYETAKVADSLSKIEGSKIKQLKVSNAFHSPLMLDAQVVMEKEIKAIKFNKPISDIIPNVLGYATNDVDTIKKSLIEQITGQVKWFETIIYMKDIGINQLYEVGPGEVLKKLNQTITLRPKCSSLL